LFFTECIILVFLGILTTGIQNCYRLQVRYPHLSDKPRCSEASQFSVKNYGMPHGRRKGQGGQGPPWILKFLVKKCCLFSFEWEKANFTTCAPPGKILE